MVGVEGGEVFMFGGMCVWGGGGGTCLLESYRSIPVPVICRVKYNETDTILNQTFCFLRF